MDTKQLTTFVTLAEVNNYIKAADKLNYAPSTLAKHIHGLEQELNVKLVEYRGNKISLTTDGRRFYGYAVRMLEAYWDAAEEFSAPGMSHGVIHVAGGEPIMGFSLAGLFLDFSSRYPDISVNIQTTCCARVPDWIRDHEVDMGYIHEMEPIKNDAYTSVPLFSEPICFLTTPKNPLTQKSQVLYKDLEGQKFAFTYDNCCFTAAFRNRMRKEGITPSSELFLGSVSAVTQSVLQDDRIALIPYSAVPHLREEGLICLSWEDEPIRPWVQVLYDRNKRLSPAEKELIRQAQQYAEDLISEDLSGQIYA